MDAVDKYDERKFYEAAGMWTPHSSEKETETLAAATMRYFTPDGYVSKRRTSDHDADIRLILKGITLGDIAGGPYEAVGTASAAKDDDPYLYRRLPFLQPLAKYSDDTAMASAICRAAKEIREKESRHRSLYIPFMKRLKNSTSIRNGISHVRTYEKWMKYVAKKWPDAGYGGHFYRWAVKDEKDDDFRSYGNGGAMRAGCIGAVFDDVRTVIREAFYSSLPTHSDPEGIKGAVVTAVAVFMGLSGISKDEILSYMSRYYDHEPEGRKSGREVYPVHPDMTIKEMLADPEIFTLSLKSQVTMPEVIIDIRESYDYESCIRNSFRYLNDTDTIGAISGGIAAAVYRNTDVNGMDTEKEINSRVPDEMIRIAMGQEG